MTQTGILKDRVVTVFGGSGFIGTHVAQALLACGARLRIASRRPERALRMKPLANLGQIQFLRCDIRDEASVAGALYGADAVVNLVGAFDGDLKALMGDAAGRIARLAAAGGTRAMVHVSAIGADAGSESGYARAKALGERLVLEAFPAATILRPSVVFGEEDTFINMFAGLIRMSPVLPVFGPQSRLQPLHVDDLAEAVAAALLDPARHGGKTFELGGPETLTMLELNQRIAAGQQRSRTFLPVPDSLSGLFAALPGTPMGRDQWIMLQDGSVPSGALPGFAALGIEPKPLDLFLDRWMERYRKHGRFTGRAKMT
ncbi:MAG: complex I NDUFA9 subunit family protein [Erythrobacter sp. 34-65-8]|nr:MAG: complex I NDUFA9 subunit family protein [Erythrobacter sp. 34-65-8]